MAAALEDEFAGNQTRAPLVFLRAALFPIGGNILLGNSVDDGADTRPDAGACAHRARLVRGIENEVGQIAAVAAADVFQGFQFDMFDAGSGGLYAVAGAGDDHFTPADELRDDRADGIVATIAGAFGLVDGELHESFLGFIGGGDHGREL